MSAAKRQGSTGTESGSPELFKKTQREPDVPAWQDMPARFTVTVPDDAMAPRVVRGYEVVFDSTKLPRDGDGVCILDGAGEAFFRIYRDTRDGYFEAVPLNSAYRWPRFDSKVDPLLRVVGVLVNVLCVDAIDCEDDDAKVSFRYLCLAAVSAWRRASEDARGEGRQFSDWDCYLATSRRSRGALQ